MTEQHLRPSVAKLIAAREAAGLSRAELAWPIEASEGAIGRIEDGLVMPSIPTAAAIAIALGVDIHDVTDVVEGPHPVPDLSEGQLNQLASILGIRRNK